MSEITLGESAPCCTDEHESGSVRAVRTGSDGVELALARALERASAEGHWDVVLRLADELAARRQARTRDATRVREKPVEGG